MNYYGPRELRDDDGDGIGKWHYTVMNDGRVRAVGYCSPWQLCAKCKGRCGFLTSADRCEACDSKGIVKLAEPCPGHSTPEEACEHYRQWLLDDAIISGPKQAEWPKHRCAADGCNQEATHLVEVGPGRLRVFQLCADHAKRETLDKLVSVVGESASSF